MPTPPPLLNPAHISSKHSITNTLFHTIDHLSAECSTQDSAYISTAGFCFTGPFSRWVRPDPQSSRKERMGISGARFFIQTKCISVNRTRNGSAYTSINLFQDHTSTATLILYSLKKLSVLPCCALTPIGRRHNVLMATVCLSSA